LRSPKQRGYHHQVENKPPEKKKIPKNTKDFLLFLLYEIIEKKKWMLLPLWVLLAVVGLLLILTGNSHLLPAIYILL
jgi:hypothetical protein